MMHRVAQENPSRESAGQLDRRGSAVRIRRILRSPVHFFRRHATLGWLLLFVPTIVLFYWKILLTSQFSLLTEGEDVHQAYSWLRFWISSVRRLALPLWDPYAFAGHTFCGEMQTAAFYPLHLLLAVFPLNHNNMLSPRLYQDWWAAAHLLGACFLFLLVREFGLSYFPAFVAGLSFALGGFVGRATWPHLLESSIWLPLIFLFLYRALRIPDTRRALLNASMGGLALGMSVLAGGLHLVILQALVVVSAGVYHAAHSGTEAESLRQRWMKSALVVALIAAVGGAAGAVQLLPSIEYSARSLRWLGSAGPVPSNQPIPYEYMTDALSPQGILTLLVPNAFNGNNGQGEVPNPYLGVFPLFMAVIGIGRNWRHPWVRYLTGLAVAALLYSFGPFSWLNGVLYAIVPKLWVAREAPRVLYLADFSLAILAGFGIETLLTELHAALWPTLRRVLAGVVIVSALCLLVPGFLARPEINVWVSLSIVLIFVSYALLHYVARGNSGPSAKFLIIALILFDLGAFDWTARGVISTGKKGADHLSINMSLQGAVNFLKSRPGVFRVQVLADPTPNIGDLFGVPSSFGAGATMPSDFTRIAGNRDLLNVRYLVRPASAPEPGPVYQDAAWKVYENPTALPRAWIVHETVVDQSKDGELPQFDPARAALVSRPLQVKLDSPAGANSETVLFSTLENNQETLRVHAQNRGLLVVSETYYPGWRAFVNGAAQQIYPVDGDLRGVIVPAGDSQVILRYRPASFYVGAGLSFLAFVGTLLFWFKARRSPSTAILESDR